MYVLYMCVCMYYIVLHMLYIFYVCMCYVCVHMYVLYSIFIYIVCVVHLSCITCVYVSMCYVCRGSCLFAPKS